MANRAYFDKEKQQYLLRKLTKKVESFESGEEYTKLLNDFQKIIRALNKTINKQKKELSEAHAETVTVRNIWSGVVDDLIEEHDKKKDLLLKEIERLKEKIHDMARQRDDALDTVRDLKKELYQVKTELLEAEEKINGLNIRINKDYTNSSKPSSQSPNHKTIPNGRIKSGKKPGGQPGHKHHSRKLPESASETVNIPATDEMLNNPDLRLTKEKKEKYLVKCHLVVEVVKYTADVYRNTKTGGRVHAPFPANIKDEINYDGTVKACAFLLKDKCDVSICNVQAFLREISGDRLNLSTGLISNLTREFSEKTEEERNDIYLELYNSPILHSDFTFGRVGGGLGAVIICANEDGVVLYQSRDKKGDEGVKGSPLEHFEGITITDHDASLIKHGSKHQECLIHVSRYLISSIEYEKALKWNKKMKKWIEKSMAYRDRVAIGAEAEDAKKDAALKSEYDEIIALAKIEYDYEPPSNYFKEGYNTFKRMAEKKEDYVLFLEDKSVSPNNNIVERYARKYKRKNIQVMCFRSKDGAEYFCDGLSVLETLKNKGVNLFEAVATRFNR